MNPSDSPAEFLLFNQPDDELTQEDRSEVRRMLAKPNSSAEEQIRTFEERIRLYTGSHFAIAISSGATGLQLCMRAVDIQPGDLVITTPLTARTSVNLLLAHDAVPVLVDVEPRTGNIDAHLVFAALQDIMYGSRNARAWLPPRSANVEGKLKAILPVDVLGQHADLELILNSAWKYRVKVIEDAREALGSAYKGHQSGTLADLGVYEFPSDRETTSDGCGMIITDDEQAAQSIIALRDQDHNSKDASLPIMNNSDRFLPEVKNTAWGQIYLQRLNDRITKRSQVANWYNQRLSGISGIEIPAVGKHTSKMNWSIYVIRLAPGLNRDAITKKLTGKGILVKPYHLPIHLMPEIKQRFGYKVGTFPVTEDLTRRCLVLPFSGLMQEEQVEQVCQALRQCL
jgi:perosamine synthetase